jgi:hypothetical protein
MPFAHRDLQKINQPPANLKGKKKTYLQTPFQFLETKTKTKHPNILDYHSLAINKSIHVN